MKIFSISLLVLCFATTVSFGQSKKDLRADIARLNTEIEELKRSKEVDFNDQHAKSSYALGLVIASNIQNQGMDSVDLEALVVAIEDVLEEKTLKLEEDEAAAIVQEYVQEGMTRKSEKLKEENARFLEENKSKEGVVVTESGLQYEIISEGSGKSPAATDEVTVHYVGKLTDGTVFDSSVERGEPVRFGVGQVIPGWTEALQMMKEGDKWLVYIPYDLGYGERGAGGQIPPFATLIFEIELLEVNN